MKRFLVFGQEVYGGVMGWSCFLKDCATFEDAKQFLKTYKENGYKEGHIVDTMDPNKVMWDREVFEKEWSEDFREWLTDEELEEKKRLQRLKESSGLTKYHLRVEIDKRLNYFVTKEYQECSHCALGKRHFIGNCILCGWGPAPGSIEFMQFSDGTRLKPLPIHEINGLVSS